MQIKVLLITSTIMDTWEPLTAMTMRLLEENQLVGILGPTGLSMHPHPNLQLFTMLPDAREFQPNIVIPLDIGAAHAMLSYWGDCKAHTLYKDKLSLAVHQLRSFGLSLLSSAGIQTVNHMVLSNQNDLLRFEAKKQSEPGEWELFADHPDARLPSEMGNLAVQKAFGESLSLCVLVNDSKAGREEGATQLPPIAFKPLQGLLRKGGLKDHRGLVGAFVNSPTALALSRKVKVACQSIGLKGLVFLDMLYSESDSNGIAARLYTVAPAGFMSMLLYGEMLEGPFHETLLALLKDRRFPLRHNTATTWVRTVTNPLYQSDTSPVEWGKVPGLVSSAQLPLPCYELGYQLGREGDFEGLWEICPTAEVKLDIRDEAQDFNQLLDKLKLRVAEVPAEEKVEEAVAK